MWIKLKIICERHYVSLYAFKTFILNTRLKNRNRRDCVCYSKNLSCESIDWTTFRAWGAIFWVRWGESSYYSIKRSVLSFSVKIQVQNVKLFVYCRNTYKKRSKVSREGPSLERNVKWINALSDKGPPPFSLAKGLRPSLWPRGLRPSPWQRASALSQIA